MERLKGLTAEKNIPVAQVAIQWLLSKPAVSSFIAGAKRMNQLEENARADRSGLLPEEITRIEVLL